jgi:hypothetical protein
MPSIAQFHDDWVGYDFTADGKFLVVRNAYR